MKQFKLIYNPKEINGEVNKAKVTDMYGAREAGREDGRLMEKPAVYSIAPNELKKFRADVADYLLKKFDFLQKVEPRDVDKVLKEMKQKRYKCQLCDFKTDTSIALKGHMRSHKLSDEAKKILEEIPEAKPEAYVIGAEFSKTRQTEFVSPEQAEGIPMNTFSSPRKEGPKDSDGVEWYGGGKQEDRRGTPGQRPTAMRGGTPGQRPVRRPAMPF